MEQGFQEFPQERSAFRSAKKIPIFISSGEWNSIFQDFRKRRALSIRPKIQVETLGKFLEWMAQSFTFYCTRVKNEKPHFCSIGIVQWLWIANIEANRTPIRRHRDFLETTTAGTFYKQQWQPKLPTKRVNEGYNGTRYKSPYFLTKLYKTNKYIVGEYFFYWNETISRQLSCS